MSRMFLAPSRYVQGAGAIAEMGIHAARMGTKALFIGGPTRSTFVVPALRPALKTTR